MSPMVEIHSVTKQFGRTVALDDVRLTIGEGQFFALVGPSGSGKTTLLHIQMKVGTTFVHVTHDQEEAMSIADVIAVMNSGRIEEDRRSGCT